MRRPSRRTTIFPKSSNETSRGSRLKNTRRTSLARLRAGRLINPALKVGGESVIVSESNVEPDRDGRLHVHSLAIHFKWPVSPALDRVHRSLDQNRVATHREHICDFTSLVNDYPQHDITLDVSNPCHLRIYGLYAVYQVCIGDARRDSEARLNRYG